MTTLSIPLTQGKFAQIDEADYDLVRQYRWQVKIAPSGVLYAQTTLPRGHESGLRTLPLHRLILSAPNGMQVDHINGDGLDNRRCNLRLATRSQNAMNRNKHRNGTTSQYKGVHFMPKRNCWRARICHNWRQIHVGYFDSEVDAAKAYDKMARHLCGEFARVNFLDDDSHQGAMHE